MKKGLPPENQPWMSSLGGIAIKVRMGELQPPGCPWPVSERATEVQSGISSAMAGCGHRGPHRSLPTLTD